MLRLKAISIFLNKHETLQHHALSKAQLKVLQDICEFLSYPHEVQQAVSAEKTPTLTHVLPLYEKLALLYRLAVQKLPELCGARKAWQIFKADMDNARLCLGNEYVRQFILSFHIFICPFVVLNPTVGFKWMEENWTPEECTATKKVVIDAVSTKITTKCHQSDCNPS